MVSSSRLSQTCTARGRRAARCSPSSASSIRRSTPSCCAAISRTTASRKHGGFGRHTLEPWGEAATKHYVEEATNEAPNSAPRSDAHAAQRFYRVVLGALTEAGVPFLVGGGYALRADTRLKRTTRDPIRAAAESLDWTRLVARFGDNWRVLPVHLLLFGFV